MVLKETFKLVIHSETFYYYNQYEKDFKYFLFLYTK